jgi:hypothetical protein
MLHIYHLWPAGTAGPEEPSTSPLLIGILVIFTTTHQAVEVYTLHDDETHTAVSFLQLILCQASRDCVFFAIQSSNTFFSEKNFDAMELRASEEISRL